MDSDQEDSVPICDCEDPPRRNEHYETSTLANTPDYGQTPKVLNKGPEVTESDHQEDATVSVTGPSCSNNSARQLEKDSETSIPSTPSEVGSVKSKRSETNISCLGSVHGDAYPEWSSPNIEDNENSGSDISNFPSGRIISHYSNVPRFLAGYDAGSCVDGLDRWEIRFGNRGVNLEEINWDELYGKDHMYKRRIVYGENVFDKDFHLDLGDLRVYRRRWYILIVFALYAFTQACVWNTFGPISTSCKRVFGWENSMIALLANLGPIAYIMSGIFFSWMLDARGLRLSVIVGCMCVATGTAVRCITMETPAVTGLVIMGQFLNGLGGPVALAGSPVLSSAWFPARERTTATAVGSISVYAGVAFAFVLGPNFVPEMSSSLDNMTTEQNGTGVGVRPSWYPGLCLQLWPGVCPAKAARMDLGTSLRVENQILKTRYGIRLYLMLEAIWACSLFVAMLVYFPKRPPVSPSVSSVFARDDFLPGLKRLLRRKDMWQVSLIYGMALGILNCWASLLSLNLARHGIGEREAGMIGFYGTLSACCASLFVARFVDEWMDSIKWFIFGLLAFGDMILAVFCLAYVEIVTPSKGLFYATIMSGITVLDAAVPMFYELACEMAYPVGEGTAAVMMTLICNTCGFFFLFIMMIPGIGTTWMNYTIVIAISACLPVLASMKESLNRLAVDSSSSSRHSTISDLDSQYVGQLQQEDDQEEEEDDEVRSTDHRRPPATGNSGISSDGFEKACKKKAKEGFKSKDGSRRIKEDIANASRKPRVKDRRLGGDKTDTLNKGKTDTLDKGDATQGLKKAVSDKGGTWNKLLISLFGQRTANLCLDQRAADKPPPFLGHPTRMTETKETTQTTETSENPRISRLSRPSIPTNVEIALKRVIEATNLLELQDDEEETEEKKCRGETEVIKRCSDLLALVSDDLQDRRPSTDVRTALRKVVRFADTVERDCQLEDPELIQGIKKLRRFTGFPGKRTPGDDSDTSV